MAPVVTWPPTRLVDPMAPRLLATSDLHVNRTENEAVVEDLHPTDPGDWLIVAGDVGDRIEHLRRTLSTLAERFARVIWVPGNHELWTRRDEEVDAVGPARYAHLVEVCRALGVLTPEDEWPVWEGDGRTGAGVPAVPALRLLVAACARTWSGSASREALEVAREAGVVCTDEFLMSSDPYPGPPAWCAERLALIRGQRLAARPAGMPTVLVNHWPLTALPLQVLRHPEFALWCGSAGHRALAPSSTTRRRWSTGTCTCPRTTWEDGVRFEEVSVGYPREWQRHGLVRGPLRQILPAPPVADRDPFTAWAVAKGRRGSGSAAVVGAAAGRGRRGLRLTDDDADAAAPERGAGGRAGRGVAARGVHDRPGLRARGAEPRSERRPRRCRWGRSARRCGPTAWSGRSRTRAGSAARPWRGARGALGGDRRRGARRPARRGARGGVLGGRAVRRWRRLAAARPEVSWDRLLFSAKESVYKTWFPLTGRWLGFEDAELVAVGGRDVPGPAARRGPDGGRGRGVVVRGSVGRGRTGSS